MPDDFERRLRGARPDLDPDDLVEARLRTNLGLRGRRPRRGPGKVGILVAVALMATGAVAAQQGWTPADLPAFGTDDAAFVLPTDELLPDGTARTRPPRIGELPDRPGLAFPVGTTHTDAVQSYFDARQRGESVPDGVELVESLPPGKVALIDDERVVIDPAAPLGYDPESGVVLWPDLRTVSVPGREPREPRIGKRVMYRCQVLLGAGDAESPDCAREDAPRGALREGVGGRWLPSRSDPYSFVAITGSDKLSVLDRPRRKGDQLPADALRGLDGGIVGLDVAPARSRRVATSRFSHLYIVPAKGDDRFCIVSVDQANKGAAGFQCGVDPRDVLVQGVVGGGPGVVLLDGKRGGWVRQGIVGDGFDTVGFADGSTAPITDNGFSVSHDEPPLDERPAPVRYIEGPAGRVDIDRRYTDAPGYNAPEPILDQATTPVALTLSNGKRVAFRSSPTTSGRGRCTWLTKTSGGTPNCRTPRWAPGVDEVTTWFMKVAPKPKAVILRGEVAPRVTKVRVRFADGAEEDIDVEDRLVLYEVPRDRLETGREPVEVITIDVNGVPLQSEEASRLGLPRIPYRGG